MFVSPSPESYSDVVELPCPPPPPPLKTTTTTIVIGEIA